MKAYFSDIKILLLTGAIFIALIPLLYNTALMIPKPLPKPKPEPEPAPQQVVDLTLGKIENFAGFSSPFVEQKEVICDQQNLKAAFGNTMDLDNFKPALFKTLPSLYGETNWWYMFGGKIVSIENKENPVIYTVENGNTSLKINVFPDKTSIGINSGPKDAKKIDADSLNLGDRVTFYSTIKCGGNKPPSLTVQMVYSEDFIERHK